MQRWRFARSIRGLLVGGLALVWAWCHAVVAQTASPTEPWAFVVMGDVPYSTAEVDRTPAFVRLIQAVNRIQPAFSIHLGDIKSGSTRCDDATFAAIKAQFMTFQHPLVYTPGDNEWTDCHRQSNGAFDPQERLAKLRTLFFAEPLSLGQPAMPLTRQSDVSAFPFMVENARWVVHNFLFVTVHVVGSNNNLRNQREAALEFFARNTANLAWITEAFALAKTEQRRGLVLIMHGEPDFQGRNRDGDGLQETIDTLAVQAAEFGKPVLLIHGDGHRLTIDQPLRHPSSKKILDNVLRLEIFGEQAVHAMRVMVLPQEAMPFVFHPLFVPENMDTLRR